MVFGAKALNASGKKTKLDPQFHNQADIMECERFERRYEFGQIFFASDGTGHKNPADSRCSEPFGPSEDLPPVNSYIIPFIIPKLRLSNELLNRIPNLRILAVQQKLQNFRIETRSFTFERGIGLSGDRGRGRPFVDV